MIRVIKKPIGIMQKFIRWCYDYLLELSNREKAIYFLAAISFIESSFFPIPPDVMIIPMVLAAPQKAWKIASIATIFSVIGGYFGYAIGYWGYNLIAEPILNFYGYMEQFKKFGTYYNDYGAWIVFVAGTTPFPYKVITITSGVMHMDIWIFGIASVFARGARFFLVAWLLKKYGEPIKYFIEKYLGTLTVIFVILLIAGFYGVKFIN